MTYEQALENLYQVFSKYPLKEMDCYPCGCVKEKYKASLLNTPLREIEEEVISYYSFKSLTTMGDLEDFKHFLPRSLEFLREVYTDIIYKKISENDFNNWNKAEVVALKVFFEQWFIKMIREKYINADDFHYLPGFIDLKPILYKWIDFKNKPAISEFVFFIINNYDDIFEKGTLGINETDDYNAIPMLKQWLHSKELKERLEALIDEYKEKDKDLVFDIKIAYDKICQ